MEFAASYIFPLFFLSFLTLVRGPQIDQQRQASETGKFPVMLPKWQDYTRGQEFELKGDPKQPCLLYMESLSVVLFRFSQEPRVTAWAEYGNGTEFSGSMECPDNQNVGTQFNVELNINEPADGYTKDQLSKGLKGTKIFTVKQINIVLTFNFTQPGYWQLVNAEARNINGDSNNKEWQFPSINGESSILVTGLAKDQWLVPDKQAPAWNINGFKDYGFSCAQTNPIVWAAAKGTPAFAVGITFNNIQMQLNATYTKDGNTFAKFGRKVNDCQPLFSIGTWMGLIISLLLIAVLSFGFLMLNSVQTMDRFDDPKQKQLIINAKE